MRPSRIQVAVVMAAIVWSVMGAAVAAPNPGNQSVVRVNVTSQAFDFFRPWLKRAPFSRSALGVVLPEGRVLVTAELLANHNFVELEKAVTGQKAPAIVSVIDYQANLAVLQCEDAEFMKALKPVEVAIDAKVGDRVTVWQLEENGILAETEGRLTTVSLEKYPDDLSSFMTYRVAVSLQYRESSFVIPVMRDGKLVGLLNRYDTKTQSGSVLPGPIIQSFLNSSATVKPPVFPVIAFSYASTRDPQLRQHAGIQNGKGGVYITEVLPESWAAKAGLQRGDILLAIDDQEIDQEGNYAHPLHNKMQLEHLISGGAKVGQKVALQVWRGNEVKVIEAVLEAKDADSYLSPPYILDRAPDYVVLGGLIFQELSRQYLKQWGPNWRTAAPQRLVYLDQFQQHLFPPERKRLVFLGQVLPSDGTVGYEGLSHLVVTKVNDQTIETLSDLRKAMATPLDGFHKIEFEESPRLIYLDAAQVAKEEPALRQAYQIPPPQAP